MASQPGMHRVCQGSAPPNTLHPQPRLCRQENLSIPKALRSRCRGRAGFHGRFLFLSPAPPPSPSLPLPAALPVPVPHSTRLHIPNEELPTVGSPLHVLATNPRKSLLQATRCPLPAPNPFPGQRQHPGPRLALCPHLSPACPLPPRRPGDHCTVERHVSIDLQSNLIGLWRPLDWFHLEQGLQKYMNK